MGAWDYGALDNDPAMDVQEKWERWIEDPSYGYKAGIDSFFEDWGDSVRYGDSTTNAEIIALAALHLNKGMKVPERVRKAAIDALNRELVPDELGCWSEPKRREAALLRMLAEFRGKRRVPPPVDDVFHPAVHFRTPRDARSRLLKFAEETIERISESGYLGFSGACSGTKIRELEGPGRASPPPPFLQTLDRLMNHRIQETDSTITERAWAERRMMLAMYLELSSGGSLDDVRRALDRYSRYNYSGPKQRPTDKPK